MSSAHPLLRAASRPLDNSGTLDSAHYTIALLAHDYPAKTPLMWNHAYRTFGLNIRNIAMIGDPARAAEIFLALRTDPRYLGGGAGVGFKEIAAALVDDLDPPAAEIGSVNLLEKTPSAGLRGHNTDGEGYAQGLQQLLESKGRTLAGSKALMLGAGGTAAAIAFALARRSVQLVIINRNTDRAGLLAQRVHAHWGGEDAVADHIGQSDIVINTSTKGATGELSAYSALAPANLPVSQENIFQNHQAAANILARASSHTVISDVVLVDGGTPLLNAAKAAGFITLNGLPMVLNQAIQAFWILHHVELTNRGASRSGLESAMASILYKSASD